MIRIIQEQEGRRKESGRGRRIVTVRVVEGRGGKRR
jgi:hypothetical protein